MNLIYQYMAIFYNFPPTSNQLHPLQVEICDGNSRLVVDEDDNGNSGLKGLNTHLISNNRSKSTLSQHLVFTLFIELIYF